MKEIEEKEVIDISKSCTPTLFEHARFGHVLDIYPFNLWCYK